MISRNRLMTTCRTTVARLRLDQPGLAVPPAVRFAAPALSWMGSGLIVSSIPLSVLGAESPEQQHHDEHHGDCSDHADRRGVALPPEAELERLIVHEDRP